MNVDCQGVVLIGIGKKLLRILLVVWLVTVLTFLMVSILPGDAAFTRIGFEGSADDIRAAKREMGLDRNVLVRYALWVRDLVTGDLGTSLITREPVFDAICARLPVTIELMLLAQLIALLLAVPTGMLTACKPNTLIDKALMTMAFAMISVPIFMMGIALIFCFAVKLQWLPATGYVPLSQGIWANLRSFLLPAVSIALVEWVVLMRVLRNDMIDTLQEEYILMARSKGLPAGRILIRHALRPSVFTLITIVGMQVGYLIGGALVVETIFALPGIGRLLVTAIYDRDVTVIQGCVLLITVAYVLVNAAVDIGYAALDPRIRKGGAVG